MTDEQRAALSPDSQEYKTRCVNLDDRKVEGSIKPGVLICLFRVTGSQIQLAGWSSYSVLLWSLKASLLVFYMRLTVRAYFLYYYFIILEFTAKC